jgi:hypothetical protein
LISYSGHEIKAVGKATIAVECKNKYYLLDVQVVNSDVIPVLGLPSSNELNLIQRIHNIESSNDQSTEEILESMNIYLKELVLYQENMKLKLKNLSVQQFIHQDEFRTC